MKKSQNNLSGNKIQVAGLAWFSEDDYDSFKKIIPDRRWHPTFGEWEAAAKQALQHFQNQGIRAIKAQVISTDFVKWCESTGRNIDTKALNDLANDLAFKSIRRN